MFNILVGERKAQKENSDGLRTTRQQRFHVNSSVIVISSDDNENDKVKGHDSNGDSVEELCSTSIKYPGIWFKTVLLCMKSKEIMY